MAKGIVYIMTTAVSGLIKIGCTKTEQFSERMRYLESNGYYNVVGLRREFAIELEDYTNKEKMLHEIFSRSKVAESELFSLDVDLVKQLLLSFDGRVVYPRQEKKQNLFMTIAKVRKQSELFSFYKKGLKNGDKIVFIKDKKVIAKVVDEREVEYCGQVYKLSPLVKMLFEQRGELNASGAYQGAAYFTFNGKKLTQI